MVLRLHGPVTGTIGLDGVTLVTMLEVSTRVSICLYISVYWILLVSQKVYHFILYSRMCVQRSYCIRCGAGQIFISVTTVLGDLDVYSVYSLDASFDRFILANHKHWHRCKEMLIFVKRMHLYTFKNSFKHVDTISIENRICCQSKMCR